MTNCQNSFTDWLTTKFATKLLPAVCAPKLHQSRTSWHAIIDHGWPWTWRVITHYDVPIVILWLFIFIPPINVSFWSEVTDCRSSVANVGIARRTLCTGAAAIMTLFTDINHLCYHIQSDISSHANCEMRKRKICLSVKCEKKANFVSHFLFLGLPCLTAMPSWVWCVWLMQTSEFI